MGKSDPYLLRYYLSFLEDKCYDVVGYFGQACDNFISKNIRSKESFFYDLSLKNWNINTFPYKVNKKFDLIVCTRCAYFSKEPIKMLLEFKSMLNPGGTILIDWGLGDHWRFDMFKVGWVM